MLSMGVMDEFMLKPNKYGSSQSDFSFYIQLAHQISNLIYPLLTNVSNSTKIIPVASCMDLATVYCRINRARGMNLISPDDLIRACDRFESENLPLRLKSYSGGLLVKVKLILMDFLDNNF